jgi:hypothetical protein
MRKNIKNFITLLLALTTVFSLSTISFAEDNQERFDRQNLIDTSTREIIIHTLGVIARDKEELGFGHIDFTALSIGHPIQAYELRDRKTVQLDFCLYPLCVDDALVALAWTPFDSAFSTINTAFVEGIVASVSIYDDFALIFDRTDCYIYASTGLIALGRESCLVIESRDIASESNANLSRSQYRRSNASEALGFTETDILPMTRNTAILSVTHKTQNPYSYICWAACIAMIGNYITSQNKGAADVAFWYYKDYNFDHSLSMQTSVTILNSMYSLSYAYYSTIPTATVIYNSLVSVNTRPVQTAWAVSNLSINHFTVVYGADTTNNILYVLDPQYPNATLGKFSVQRNNAGQYQYVVSTGATLTLGSGYNC